MTNVLGLGVPAYLSLAGAFVVAVGGVIAAAQSYRAKRERELLHAPSSAWIIFIGAMIGAFGSILGSTEAARDQAALKKKAEDALSAITGGDSYPWMETFELAPERGTFVFAVRNDGNYPLYDVTAQLDDVNKELGFIHTHGSGRWPSASWRITKALGNIGAHQSAEFNTIFKMPDDMNSQTLMCS